MEECVRPFEKVRVAPHAHSAAGDAYRVLRTPLRRGEGMPPRIRSSAAPRDFAIALPATR